MDEMNSNALRAVTCNDEYCTSLVPGDRRFDYSDPTDTVHDTVQLPGLGGATIIQRNGSEVDVFSCYDILCATATKSVIPFSNSIVESIRAVASVETGFPIIFFGTSGDNPKIEIVVCTDLLCATFYTIFMDVSQATGVVDVQQKQSGEFLFLFSQSNNNFTLFYLNCQTLENCFFNSSVLLGTTIDTTCECCMECQGHILIHREKTGQENLHILFDSSPGFHIFCPDLSCKNSVTFTTMTNMRSIPSFRKAYLNSAGFPIFMAQFDGGNLENSIYSCTDIFCTNFTVFTLAQCDVWGFQNFAPFFSGGKMFIISRCNGLSVEYCSNPICDILFSEPVNELAVKENEKLQVGDLLLQNNGTLTVTFGSSVSVHSSAIFGEDTTIILNVSLNNVSTTEPIINISGCVTTPKKWKLHLNLSSNSDTFSSGSLNPINVLSASSFCNNSGSEPDLILDGSISENCVFTTSSASASTKYSGASLQVIFLSSCWPLWQMIAVGCSLGLVLILLLIGTICFIKSVKKSNHAWKNFKNTMNSPSRGTISN